MKKAVLIGVILGAGLTAPAVLSAKNQRYYPGYCERLAAIDSNTEGTYYLSNAGLNNIHSTDYLLAACPIDDSTYLPKDTLHHINVHGLNSNPNYPARVQACVKDHAGTGHACGSIDATGSVGTFLLQPSLTQFSSKPTWFGYLMVQLPAVYSNDNSVLFGYYGTD